MTKKMTKQNACSFYYTMPPFFFQPSTLIKIKLFVIQNFTRFSTKTKVVFLHRRDNYYYVKYFLVLPNY